MGGSVLYLTGPGTVAGLPTDTGSAIRSAVMTGNATAMIAAPATTRHGWASSSARMNRHRSFTPGP